MARPKKKAEDKAVRQCVSMDPVQLRQVVAYCQKNERTIAGLIKRLLQPSWRQRKAKGGYYRICVGCPKLVTKKEVAPAESKVKGKLLKD